MIDEDIDGRALGFEGANKSKYYASRASRIVDNRVSALQSEISKLTRKVELENAKKLKKAARDKERKTAQKLKLKESSKRREKARKLKARERAKESARAKKVRRAQQKRK